MWLTSVGRMGCVPACGGNGNSRNVSSSKTRPALLQAPLGRIMDNKKSISRYVNKLHLH